MRVYTASKTTHAHMWKSLRTEGVDVVSTWIDEAGEGQTASYAELSQRCIEEVRKAEILILYCEPGEVLRGALIEAGVALTLGKPVFCTGFCNSLSRVFTQHPLWHSCPSVPEAIRAAIQLLGDEDWNQQPEGWQTEGKKGLAGRKPAGVLPASSKPKRPA